MPQTIQLLLLCWLLMFGIAHEWAQRATTGWSWRVSCLFASVAWGTTVVAITEVLSLFHLFQRTALLTAWMSVFITAGILYASLLYRRVGIPFSLARVHPIVSPSIAVRWWKVAEWKMVFPSRLIVIMLALILFQVVTLAMVAYQYAPTHSDGLAYHLGRIVHWQQAQSVAHYATHIDRQIQMPPLASFIMAHLHTLTVGDRFVNLVQWWAMLVCLVGVTEIARHLGADQTRQVIAVLVCVSIPMGILQATSIQIDYVVSAWMVCLVAFGMNVLRHARQWAYTIGTGLALGLALLTKATAFIYAAPFAVVIGLGLLYRLRRAALVRGLVMLGLLLAINAGHFTRNTLLYGSPTGPRSGYRNDMFSLNVLASNVIRSTAVHIPLKTGIAVLDTTNAFMLGWLRLLHEFTGLDPRDPRTTRFWLYSEDAFHFQMSFTEGGSGNPLHALLIMLTTSVGTLWLWNRRQYGALGYMLVVLAAFLLFCGYLTVSPWRHRLHLPVLVLWCPVIAVALFHTNHRLILSVPIIIALFGFNWTFNNHTRPITADAQFVQETRTDAYLRYSGHLRPVYREIADRLSASSCTRVGMIVGHHAQEYPLWMLLRERGYHGVIRHIQVRNASNVYEPTDFHSCAIISEGVQAGYADFIDQYLGQREHTYLYMDPATASPPVQVPDGVTVSPDVAVGVFFGSGWYDFEPDPKVRWMRGNGRLWFYAETATAAVLHLHPHRVHSDGTFGLRGDLRVTLNDTLLGTFSVTSGTPLALPLPLRPGFNRLELRLAAGDFVPAEYDPTSPDRRCLGISLAPLELTAPSQVAPPAGVDRDPNLQVLMGAGWYDFEPTYQVRWMQANSDLWVYANEATLALLHLRPHVMHVDQAFGTTGQLTVTLNATETAVITTTTGSTHIVPLQLQAGFNRVAFGFGAGDFVPAATVPPLSADQRRLAIAFAPLGITTDLRSAQPTEVQAPADFRVLFGAGWYDFEPDWNVRWMQETGELWIDAPQATEVRLRLQPHVMHVDQTFGTRGQVRVTVNQTFGGEWALETGVVRDIPLRLRAGVNQVTLHFVGGTFVPEGDGRRLGIAFYPLELVP